MNITRCRIGDISIETDIAASLKSKVDKRVIDIFNTCAAINSTAELKSEIVTNKEANMSKEVVRVEGNKTEGAMLLLMRDLGEDYTSLRKGL